MSQLVSFLIMMTCGDPSISRSTPCPFMLRFSPMMDGGLSKYTFALNNSMDTLLEKKAAALSSGNLGKRRWYRWCAIACITLWRSITFAGAVYGRRLRPCRLISESMKSKYMPCRLVDITTEASVSIGDKTISIGFMTLSAGSRVTASWNIRPEASSRT